MATDSGPSFFERVDRICREAANEKPSALRNHEPLVIIPTKRKLGDFGNTDDGNGKSWIAKCLACEVAPSIVALSSFVGDEFLFACSGTVIKWDGMVGLVLTSASLLKGNEDAVPSNVVVKVHLPNREVVCGAIAHVDFHHNIATISVPSMDELQALSLSLNPKPFAPVMALSRHYRTYDIMASSGEIVLKDHGFDSEDVRSSSCCITQYGIGGPLIDIGSGFVIGINFTDVKCTVFLPSTIVLRCLKHFESYGRVFRPWLGMRTQLLDTLEIAHLETIYQIFPDIYGALVEKVMKGSPADSAGISPGDIITRCDGNVVCSPLEFVEILFDKAEKLKELGCDWASDHALKKRTIAVEVTIKRSSSGCTETRSIIVDRLSPFENNRWPLYRSQMSKIFNHRNTLRIPGHQFDDR